MSRHLLSLSLILVSGVSSCTAPRTTLPAPGRCTDSLSREFDFWIGTWEVVQEIRTPEGDWETYPARSTVGRALDGCALVEQWSGTVRFFWEGMTEPETMEGLSVRSRGRDGNWRIYWMDSRNPSFGRPFVGGFRDGEGLFIQAPDEAGGSAGQVRIRFLDIRAESVEWELSVLSERGAWTPLWRMHFERTRGT